MVTVETAGHMREGAEALGWEVAVVVAVGRSIAGAEEAAEGTLV
jgi:hypothetical protein